MDLSPKALIRLFVENGWYLDRMKGSHHIYKNDALKKSVPIPVHGNRDLGKNLFLKILKEAGIKRPEVE